MQLQPQPKNFGANYQKALVAVEAREHSLHERRRQRRPQVHNLDLLQAVANGATTKGLAKLHGITREAICYRLRKISQNFDARTVEHAVAKAIREGWIK